MSVSNVSFSATLPPFNQTTGFVNAFSQTNISATGTLGITDTTDPNTGQKSSTVTSNVISNGINFTGTSSQLNGDLLTVNYTSDNAANSGTDSALTSQLLKTNIGGTGISFVETSSTAHEDVGRASYDTAPNSAYTATVQNAAISSETSDSAENILLNSYSQVGNSISITYQVSNGSLSNNTVLANSQVPEQTPSSGIATSNLGAGSSPSFSATGVTNIGDLLANANGLSDNGNLTSALQSATADRSNTITHPNAFLAASLNPSVALTPSNVISLSDFINTDQNTPVSQSSPAANLNAAASNAYNAANGFDGSSANGSSSPFGTSDSGYSNHGNSAGSNSSTSNTTNFASLAGSTAIYSSIANANASTIRGTGVNTLA